MSEYVARLGHDVDDVILRLRGVDGRARTGFGQHTDKSSGSAVTSSSRCFVLRIFTET